MTRAAVFPGSFDPITNAHLDVARRAAQLFDRLVIGVLNNPRKEPLFSVDERVELIRSCVADLGEHVTIDSFDGLTVEFARRQGAGFIVRGLRAVSDFEAELQMALTNRKLAPEVDTTFLMTALEFGYVELDPRQGGGTLRRRREPDGSGPRGGRARTAAGGRRERIIRSARRPATDIIFLVERLESLVAASKKLPLTNNVVLDQATLLELIDQLRVSVPDEVRQARRITEEASRITERSQEEADAIVARAQQQAAQMLEERELVRASQQRAAEIIEASQSEAREVRRGADEYAAGVLIRLEGECIKALTSIKRGIDMLDERHRPASSDGNGPATGLSIEQSEEQTPAASRP